MVSGRFSFSFVVLMIGIVGPAALFSPMGRAVERGTDTEGVVYVSDSGSEGELHAFRMREDGTEAKRISDAAELEPEAIASMDGKRVAFTVADPTNTADIWVMNLDGSHRLKLTSEPKGVQAFGPAWSPDGKRIAYSVMERMQKIAPKFTFYCVNVDGGNRRTFGEGLLPTFSPDSKQILYTMPAKTAKGEVSLYLLNADGKETRHKFCTFAAMGVWSPDGRKIAFVSLHQNAELPPDLAVMNADGSHPSPIAQAKTGKEDLVFGTLWSPDSKRILFTRIPKHDSGVRGMQIWQTMLDGNKPTLVTKDGLMNFAGTGSSFLLLLAALGDAP